MSVRRNGSKGVNVSIDVSVIHLVPFDLAICVGDHHFRLLASRPPDVYCHEPSRFEGYLSVKDRLNTSEFLGVRLPRPPRLGIYPCHEFSRLHL